MKKICPECSFMNTDAAQFCTQCGNPLPAQQSEEETPAPPRYTVAAYGFTEALRDYWHNALNFEGRARRKAFWYAVLWNLIFSAILSVFTFVSPDLQNAVETVFGIAILAPGLSLAVRRLHDSGKSGWWLLLGLIPAVGGILLFIFMLMDSDRITNRFGKSSKYI